MAKYFKPHKKIIKDPPNADVSVSYSRRGGDTPRECNVISLNINVDRPADDYEGYETHVIELSRQETKDLVARLQNALNTKF